MLLPSKGYPNPTTCIKRNAASKRKESHGYILPALVPLINNRAITDVLFLMPVQ
jgi:hypothetical protein